MNLTAFLSSFGLIFLAELGDKTQLTAMALATRFRWTRAFIGIALAFALLNAVAVGAGRLLFDLVPLGWVKAASALLFLGFGVVAWRNARQEGEAERGARSNRGPVLTSFLLILLAELGDKTQLLTASLAAQYASPLAVFAGSTLALWAVSLLGLLVGAQVRRWIPARHVQRAAAVVFVVCGTVLAVQAAL
jgi:putative Ca2+/H+ antiporter (TMEM165/GDT1 family)